MAQKANIVDKQCGMCASSPKILIHVCPRPWHVHAAEEVGIAEKTYGRILDLEVTVPSHIPSLACLRGGC